MRLPRDDELARERLERKKIAERALTKLENGGIDTQTAIAEIIDVDRSTVSNYKRVMESET